jgi:hypothetical protein
VHGGTEASAATAWSFLDESAVRLLGGGSFAAPVAADLARSTALPSDASGRPSLLSRQWLGQGRGLPRGSSDERPFCDDEERT